MPGWRASARIRLPGAARFVVARALQIVDPLVVAAYRRRHEQVGAVPPRALRARCGQPDISQFLHDGAATARELESILADLGRPLGSFQAICDFGAGTGRVLTHIAADRSAELSACDVDDAAMAWLGTNRPSIRAVPIPAFPPTGFPDGSFDLIYALSVFTHLNEASQIRWLREISRLLRPDGLAVLTVHGPVLYEAHRTGRRGGIDANGLDALRRRAPLEEEGFVFQAYERSRWNRWKLRGTESDYGLAFHSPAYVERVWNEIVDVCEVLPTRINWRQDAVVVRRR